MDCEGCISLRAGKLSSWIASKEKKIKNNSNDWTHICEMKITHVILVLEDINS